VDLQFGDCIRGQVQGVVHRRVPGFRHHGHAHHQKVSHLVQPAAGHLLEQAGGGARGLLGHNGQGFRAEIEHVRLEEAVKGVGYLPGAEVDGPDHIRGDDLHPDGHPGNELQVSHLRVLGQKNQPCPALSQIGDGPRTARTPCVIGEFLNRIMADGEPAVFMRGQPNLPLSAHQRVRSFFRIRPGTARPAEEQHRHDDDP